MAITVILLVVWISRLITTTSCQHMWKQCSEFAPIYNFESPCICAEDGEGLFLLNCDHQWLDDLAINAPPQLTFKGYLHSHAGLKMVDIGWRLGASANNGSLTLLDLSNNRISKLDDQMFVDSLEEIYLRNNWLGDQLNPVFTTESFTKLRKLRYLDLGSNRIRAIDDGLFNNIASVQQLLLDDNQLNEVPILSLRNLRNLLILELQHNNIGVLGKTNLSSLPSSLLTLNLSYNVIDHVTPGAFQGLFNLEILDLKHNKLSSLDSSDVLDGLSSVLILDLSQNYFSRFPLPAISRVAPTLRDLRLSANEIREISAEDFVGLAGLFYLDLSANRIAHLPPNVFASLTSLKSLDLRVNLIRKLDQSHLTGLRNLRSLNLQDNNFLGWPSSTVGELQSLDSLSIGYNRIAAISPQLFETVTHVSELQLEFNLLRDIPNATFRNFTHLKRLNLRGNRIYNVSVDTFSGLESILESLDLSLNDIVHFPLLGHYRKLTELKISDNKIDRLPELALDIFSSLKQLDISRNRLLEIPGTIFKKTPRLQSIDLSNNDIKSLQQGLFHSLLRLEHLDISNNALVDIEEETFVNLPRLRHLNLANSGINNIRANAFGANLTSLLTVNLSGNYLTTFGNTEQLPLPKLSVLDLNGNQIHMFYTEFMKRWPNVVQLDLSSNRLTHIEGLPTNSLKLETLNLRNNQLQRIENGQFGHAKRLRFIDISDNILEEIEEGAFRGSTQIRFLKLSSNRLNHLNEGSFNELALLDIDISHNNISSLPPTTFAKVNIKSLVALRMHHNRLRELPVSSLDDHVVTLDEIDVAHNRIVHVSPNSNILSNVKRLNLANNPLSENSLRFIFTEPKLVQELNLANCNVISVPALETPFIRSLNLSNNKIFELKNGTFRRATLLQKLDISRNQLTDIQTALSPIWPEIPDLKSLDVSKNMFKSIGEMDFTPLKLLETLDMSQLFDLGRLGHDVLKYLPKLKHLSIYGYPRLGFYDLKGLLESSHSLESLKVEVKGNILRDQLKPAYNWRLQDLSISGAALNTLTSVSLAGLVGPLMKVTISETNITQIPNALFLPLPMSSELKFEVANNKISTLGPQLLVAIDEKKNRIQLTGIDSNPIRCDCHLKSFHRWIIEQIVRGDDNWRLLRCQQPDEMMDRFLWTLQDADLTCEKPVATTSAYQTTASPIDMTSTKRPPTTTSSVVIKKVVDDEPDIIYEAPATKPVENQPTDTSVGGAQSSLTNMDSMIIGIIVGVVAFVCILIIIICILKLRHTHEGHHPPHPHYPSPTYLSGGLMSGSGGPGSVLQGGGSSSCTCVSGSNSKEVMMNGQLGHPYDMGSKMQLAAINGMVDGRQRHHRNGNYYVAYPESDNGCR